MTTPLVLNFVSLGCAKNRVDSEHILGQLLQAGFVYSAEPEEADICIVNTCGFIGEARAEVAAELKQLAALRRRVGRPCYIVALGCLVARGAKTPELARPLKDADLCLSFADYPNLAAICRHLAQHGRAPEFSAPGQYAEIFASPRWQYAGAHSSYLKIAEGCNNACHYCAIPLIRGPQKSRSVEELEKEAQLLLANGAKEINVIAQDVTNYGLDLAGRPLLAELVERILKNPEKFWLRLLYAYPGRITPELIDRLRADERVCPYLDLPLQHIADPVLKAMGRPQNSAAIRKTLEMIRTRWPECVLRTTFMVGYPGETTAHFQELVALIREGYFTWGGVFTYSPEIGTVAYKLADNVSADEKRHRKAVIERELQKVTAVKLAAYEGKTLPLLVDGYAEDGGAVCRTAWQAPEVDGVTYLDSETNANLAIGDLLQGLVTGNEGPDLVARELGQE